MRSPLASLANEKVLVGIGELVVTNNPAAVLVTYSLGSCLGVVLYDPIVKVGGLWHVMLPDSQIDLVRAQTRPGMFVDTGWPAFLQLAGEMGAALERLEIFVIGGAQIIDTDGVFNIGKSNYLALRAAAREAELPLMGEETGGVDNRTVTLHVGDGTLWIKSSGQTEEIIL
ncbi:MAG: chemotaxis protein CheD [Limisphaerales bacterium]|jgi:chemotaxis protein CheD